jgi:hypothetical protein
VSQKASSYLFCLFAYIIPLPRRLRTAEVKNGIGQVIAEPAVRRRTSLDIDFVKNRTPIVQRTVPSKLPFHRQIDFVKNKVSPATYVDADTILDTEIRAEAASDKEDRKEKKVDQSEDFLLNDTVFEAFLPTAAARDEVIVIAETEKREGHAPRTRRGLSALKLRRHAGWNPIVAATTQYRQHQASLLAQIKSNYAPTTSPAPASPLLSSDSAPPVSVPASPLSKSQSSSNSSRFSPSRRATPTEQPSARASELAQQILKHGDLAESGLYDMLVPQLRNLSATVPPSTQRTGVTPADLEAGDIETMMRKRSASRIQSADLAAFILRRRKIAARISDLIGVYAGAFEDVQEERKRILNDFANSRLEMMESQYLFASTSSLSASRTEPGSSELAHKEQLERIGEKEQEVTSVKRMAETVLVFVEEELKVWTAVQSAWEAEQAAEALEVGAAVSDELNRLELRSMNVKMAIPEEPLLAQRVVLSNELRGIEAAVLVLRNHLAELGQGIATSRPASPGTISRDSFSDLESDLVGSFEHVGTGRSSGIIQSDGEDVEDPRQSFFLLASSLSSRSAPSQGSSSN